MADPTKKDHDTDIQNLRTALHRKEIEASELKEALKNLLESHIHKKKKYAVQFSKLHKKYSKRLVELEIDLETHDIHFTNYARKQMELETKALFEDNFDDDDKANPESRSAQKNLISKLVADHAELERRYKTECAKNHERIRVLDDKNRKLRRSIRHRDDLNSRRRGSKSNTIGINEGEWTTDTEMAETASEHTRVVRRLEKENTELMRNQNDLKKQLHALELNLIHFGANLSLGTGGNAETDETIMDVLQKETELKDKQVALLRTKAITYQTRNIWERDRDFDNGPPCMGSASSKASSTTSFEDLHKKIKELENILIQKDRELRSQTKRYRSKRIL